MKEILKAEVYIDMKNDIFKHILKTKSNDKLEIISAIAVITNDILIKLDVPLSTYCNFLKQAEFYMEDNKEDLIERISLH